MHRPRNDRKLVWLLATCAVGWAGCGSSEEGDGEGGLGMVSTGGRAPDLVSETPSGGLGQSPASGSSGSGLAGSVGQAGAGAVAGSGAATGSVGAGAGAVPSGAGGSGGTSSIGVGGGSGDAPGTGVTGGLQTGGASGSAGSGGSDPALGGAQSGNAPTAGGTSAAPATDGSGGGGVPGSDTGGADPGSTVSGGGPVGGTDPGSTVSGGTGAGAATTGGTEPGSAETGGADPGGAASGGTGSGEAETGGAEPGGTGGSTAEPELPTTGCDATSWPESGAYTIEAAGKTRDYIVTLPDDYDGTRPMRLIFVWHGLTGTMEQTAGSGFWGYFGLQNVADGSAIFVAGQGLPSAEGETDYAWRDTDDEDTAFAAAMIERFSNDYCIDASRIFSTGMSYGGVMSNETGCDLGDRIRAIAPIAGAGPGFGAWGQTVECVGEVAALLIHGTADETVPLDSGTASREHWLEANGCTATATPVAPTEYCVAYSGCNAGYPVTWCEHSGGHEIPDWSAQTIWDFFLQF